MNKDGNNATPGRQMSGRRSKPSIDLLVDNQRVLSSYTIPKKKPVLNTAKSSIKSASSQSAASLLSLKVKLRRESLRSQGEIIPTEIQSPKPVNNKRIINSKNNRKISLTKSINNKRKHIPSVENDTENILKDDESTQLDNNILSNLPYVTLKLNKIDLTDTLLSSLINDDINTENDDLPLSKVFPDFKSEPEDGPVTKKPIAIGKKTKKNKVIKEIVSKKSVSPIVTDNDSVKSPSTTSTEHISVPLKVTKRRKSRLQNGVKESQEKTVVADINAAIEDRLSQQTPLTPVVTAAPRCIMDKCTNIAIEDFRWDKEFCSPDCAMMYGKSIVGIWLEQRRAAIHQARL